MDTTVIFGPPGTGKTTKLKSLLAELVPLSPNDRIAVVSFSKAAARRMTAVLPPSPNVIVGTIHSICFHAMDLTKKDVITPEDFAKLTGMGEEMVRPVLNMKSFAANVMRPVDDVFSKFLMSNDDCPDWGLVQSVLEEYNAFKEQQIYYDFDDMLEENEPIPFDTVVVDEAQDLSPLQWQTVLKRFTPKRLIIAGDDDQAIYPFIGADPHGMAEIAKKTHDVIVLRQSYRLPILIKDYADRTIRQITKRVDKDYQPRSDMGALGLFESIEACLEMYKSPPVLLFRDKFRMEPEIETLRSLALPYVAHGQYSPFQSTRANLLRAFRKLGWEAFEGFEHMLTPEAQDPDISGDAHPIELFDGISWEDAEYLAQVDLDAEPYVLSTIHSYKGEEADHVILFADVTARVEEQAYDDEEKDNEIRVWFTGVTRAKRSLTVIGYNDFLPES